MFGLANRDKARELFEMEKFDAAIPKFTKALNSGELDADDQYEDCIRLAICYHNTNDNDNALLWLKEALKWNTENYFVYYWFAQVYYTLKKYDFALKYVNESLDRFDDAYTWDLKARILFHLNDFENAETSAKKAIDLAILNYPDNVESFKDCLSDITTAKGSAILWILWDELSKHIDNDEVDLAIGKCREILNSELLTDDETIKEVNDILSDLLEQKQENEYAELINELVEFKDKEDVKITIAKCKEMLGLENLSYDYQITLHNILGECYYDTHQYQSALSEYTESLKIDSETDRAFEAFLGLFFVNMAFKRIDHAILMRDKALGILESQLHDPRFSEADESTINNLKDSIRWVTIICDMIKLSVEKRYGDILTKYLFEPITPTDFSKPDMAKMIHNLICEALIKEKQFDNLFEYISTRVDTKGIFDAYRGIAYYHQKHYETALQCLERGINAGINNNSDVWGYKGECHFILEEYEKAIEAYSKALDTINPFNDEFNETYLGEKIRISKEKLALKNSHTIPSHITIQGNSAPISFGGVIATDNAIVNRSNAPGSSLSGVDPNFCPHCGQQVDAGDTFCKKCGKKLT